MSRYIYHVEEYIEVEADSEEEAEELLWETVYQRGTDGLDATLAEYVSDGITYICD